MTDADEQADPGGCGYSWDHTIRETYNGPDGRAWECTECGADGWEPAENDDATTEGVTA